MPSVRASALMLDLGLLVIGSVFMAATFARFAIREAMHAVGPLRRNTYFALTLALFGHALGVLIYMSGATARGIQSELVNFNNVPTAIAWMEITGLATIFASKVLLLTIGNADLFARRAFYLFIALALLWISFVLFVWAR